MTVLRWGAAALLTVTLAACTERAASPATLPPLTPQSGSPSLGTTSPSTSSPTMSAQSPSATTSTPASPTPSTSPSTDPAALVAKIPHGDNSPAAAEATARIAVSLITLANRKGDVSIARPVLSANSLYIKDIELGRVEKAGLHVHIVGDPAYDIRAKVQGPVSGSKLTVRVDYMRSALSAVTDKGKVIQDFPGFAVDDYYTMYYESSQWRVYSAASIPR